MNNNNSNIKATKRSGKNSKYLLPTSYLLDSAQRHFLWIILFNPHKNALEFLQMKKLRLREFKKTPKVRGERI